MRSTATLDTPGSGPSLRQDGEDRGFLEHFRELRRWLIARIGGFGKGAEA